MTGAARISVIVPTRNRAVRLLGLLESLAVQTTPPLEVIVVDNASDDETRAVVEAARVRGIRLPEPLGPAIARNVGWQAARGDLIVFTDDDVVAPPEWLEAIASAHAREPEAVIQGRTAPDPREAERLSAFGRSQSASGPGPWFQTCNIAYPRELLERLGGFDESFWDAAGEDTDLGWRAIEAGARVVYEPSALNWHAVHDGGPLALIRGSQKWRMAVRNVARHPDLRASLHHRIFWKRSHERLLVAIAGCVLAARIPAARNGRRHIAGALAMATVVAYAESHRSDHGSYAGVAAALPAHIAVDSAEIVAMVRGSLAARTLLL